MVHRTKIWVIGNRFLRIQKAILQVSYLGGKLLYKGQDVKICQESAAPKRPEWPQMMFSTCLERFASENWEQLIFSAAFADIFKVFLHHLVHDRTEKVVLFLKLSSV